MNNLKFRAWAVASKKMFYPDSEDGWELVNGVLNPLPNTILMQSTGLFDKNGKEIYEGDILGKEPIKEKAIWEVVYNYNGFYLKRYIPNTIDLEMYGIRNDLEIIGNIYENKELLSNQE